MECQFCKKKVSTLYILKTHQNTVKSCLKIQKEQHGINHDTKFECEHCKKCVTTKSSLTSHYKICKIKKENTKKTKTRTKQDLLKEINELKEKLKEKNKIHELHKNSQKQELSPQNELETPKKQYSEKSYNSNITEYTFDTFRVPIRNDGMINATALCTAGNKLIADYLRLSNTKAYLKALKSNMGIPILELIDVKTGGDHSGTWVHRKIGYHLAQWISPQFALKVSNILDELFVSGSIVIGQEKTSQQVELMYQQKVKTLQDQLITTEKDLVLTKQEHTTLIAKHNSTLKNHRYVKFKEKGPCFYIIESGISSLDGIERKKFGIAGTTEHDTIDDRLKSHRTLWPQLKVNYIIFIKEIDVLENSIKRLYKKEINPNGHEIIQGVSTEQLIECIEKIIIALGIYEYQILSIEKIKEYNEYVKTTLKLFQ